MAERAGWPLVVADSVAGCLREGRTVIAVGGSGGGLWRSLAGSREQSLAAGPTGVALAASQVGAETGPGDMSQVGVGCGGYLQWVSGDLGGWEEK